MAARIETCRVCGSSELVDLLNLGAQCLTGVFPKKNEIDPPLEPLVLTSCATCGLVQLAHNFDPNLMYGDNYGYRSGLNNSMVKHLKNKADYLINFLNLKTDHKILDIGSNDGTFLSFFEETQVKRFGCDPTIEKFEKFYSPNIIQVADFFPNNKICQPGHKFQLVTSIAMFYDLENPVSFVKSIADILDKDGIWHFEQSYLPTMINQKAFDTICHEHLEYYTLKNIKNILDKAGLHIIDANLNDINGGSIAITAAHQKSNFPISDQVRRLCESEEDFTIENLATFENEIKQHCQKIVEALSTFTNKGSEIWAIGASTKGNVLLQYCGLDSSLIKGIAEINPDKFGRVTPGTRIPIFPEADLIGRPDVVALVLPWHFKESIVKAQNAFLQNGGRLIFPLPELLLVTKDGEFEL